MKIKFIIPGISIHALRVEGDSTREAELETAINISIHALRVEGDPKSVLCCFGHCTFLSTPSGWRATMYAAYLYRRRREISIHALRVEGDTRSTLRKGRRCRISIHALRVEGDQDVESFREMIPISIHALRVEGDQQRLYKVKYFFNFYPRPPGGGRHFTDKPCQVVYNFYPRPPGGGRPCGLKLARGIGSFLSTPSGWRATMPARKVRQETEISIHALRVEGDSSHTHCWPCESIFLSTPSGWRATALR